MGSIITKKATNQIIIIGPERSGKSTLLYKQKLKDENIDHTETIGFQYEEVEMNN